MLQSSFLLDTMVIDSLYGFRCIRLHAKSSQYFIAIHVCISNQVITRLGSMSKAPGKKPKEKRPRIISPPVKKPPRTKDPRNKISSIQKAPQNNLLPVTNYPPLQIDVVSVPAATTYTGKHNHSKEVTRHIKPNPPSYTRLLLDTYLRATILTLASLRSELLHDTSIWTSEFKLSPT